MSEQINGFTELHGKLDKALDKLLGNDAEHREPEPGDRPLTQAEYDLRIQYVRHSWRLVGEIGPYNYRAQSESLLRAMALSKLRGDNEEAFVKRVDTIINAGMAPVATEKPE